MPLIYKFDPLQPAIQDQIAYWDNVFTNEQLAKINALPQWSSAQKAMIGGHDFEENAKKRITDVAWIELTEETKFIWDALAIVVQNLNNQFFHFDLDGFYESIQLGIYDGADGGHYNWHVDIMPSGVPRKLSLAMLVSNLADFEGGQLQVKTTNDEPINLEQKQGRAWVFPSVFLHRVTPVTKGTRRSLVIWAGGKAFR